VAVDRSGLPTIQAAFADAAQAERAVAQLQHHGVDLDRIDVEHGDTAEPGRTAAEDRELADRITGSWATGAAVGTITGVLLGAIIGGVAFGWFGAGFWGLTIGLGAALGGVGALWGMFAGFAGRSTRTRDYDADHPPELPDAVRVTVATKPGEHDTVRRILAEKGGA
jgi:predicted lipid-binding transport protein (Tim44 family)